MSIVSNTQTTYDVVGHREDLSDAIYNISPEETPFMSNAGRATAKQTLSEWQTDSLADPDGANAHIEGDETTFAAAAPTVRLGNYTQISKKTAIVSGSEEASEKAGRDSEMAYQLSKRSAELKRDMETILVGTNQAAAAGDSATARKTGSLLAFVKTNVDKAGDGNNPTYTSIPNDTRDDGTTRVFTEPFLKSVMQTAWAAGAKPDTILCGGLMKQLISTFSGIASSRFNVQGAKPSVIIGAADIYVSDFGNLSVVPDRFSRARDVWFLDFDFIDIAYFRKFKTEKLAKTGDAEKRHILGEYMLKVKNEKALALFADGKEA